MRNAFLKLSRPDGKPPILISEQYLLSVEPDTNFIAVLGASGEGGCYEIEPKSMERLMAHLSGLCYDLTSKES